MKNRYPEIAAGMFHGLHKAVHEKTGISLPVIHKALSEGDDRSPKKLEAIRVAIELIREREHGLYPMLNEEPENTNSLAEPVLEYGTLDLSGEYTYWDYLKWSFMERVELIKGKVVKMSPAPSLNHQLIVRVTNRYFDQYFLGKPCGLFYAPFDVRLPVPGAKKDSTVVQPDLCVVCDLKKVDQRGCFGVPDLIVEILSPGNSRHDLNVKFKLYESAGVKEYWLVSPSERTVLIYCLEGKNYVGLRPFTEGMDACGRLFTDFFVPVDELFRFMHSQ